jgi:hypothetical protein
MMVSKGKAMGNFLVGMIEKGMGLGFPGLLLVWSAETVSVSSLITN